jgi:hypothetical protein
LGARRPQGVAPATASEFSSDEILIIISMGYDRALMSICASNPGRNNF